MKERHPCLITTLTGSVAECMGCVSTDTAAVSIAPKPSNYAEVEGKFELTGSSRIVVTAGNSYDEVKQNIAEYLAKILRNSTGFNITVADAGAIPASGDIVLGLRFLDEEPDEAYTLKVETDRITLTANEPAGLFRGVQTLRQLFGPDIERKSPLRNRSWTAPCAAITDRPAYQYRGLMIDIARHFFPKEAILRQIDHAAQYKINKLHLHLTNDQGWRIEIKSRPALTEIGSLGAVNNDQGGYLTQKEFIEIVEYAATRYIEVIPEINMPGHMNAALASIPELNPNRIPARQRFDIEVGYSTLMTRLEETYNFIDDVIRELAAISPSKYFHIGGDEADATLKDNYHYFMGRVSGIAKKYGKLTIGWTPYDDGEGIVGDAVVQHWHCNPGTFDSSNKKNLAVILSPAGAYLDQKYNPNTQLGLQWRGYVSLESSYRWYPKVIAPASRIFGVESALWTETIVTEEDMDYMLYPRLIANAEIGWTTEKNRDFADFMMRLPGQLARLDALGIKYSKDYQ